MEKQSSAAKTPRGDFNTFSPGRRENEDMVEISDERLLKTRNDIEAANGELNSCIAGLNEALDKKLKK